MNEFVDTLKQFNDNFSNIKNFLQHPFLNTAQFLLNGLVAGSKTICLSGAVISVVLYILGFDKCAKYAGFFFLLYFLIQCIGMVL